MREHRSETPAVGVVADPVEGAGERDRVDRRDAHQRLPGVPVDRGLGVSARWCGDRRVSRHRRLVELFLLSPTPGSGAGRRVGKPLVSNRRGGRHAFDASAVTDAWETPQLREGRRGQRKGVLVVVVSVAALAFGLVADIINLIPGLTGWHTLVTAAFVFGGMFTIQGIRMIRGGGATVRDELRRQADTPSAGRSGDGE